MKKLIKNLLSKYVDWERMWYVPKCKFKKGDKIKPNWKANAHLNNMDEKQDILTFLSVDKDGVITTEEGRWWNVYWMTKA